MSVTNFGLADRLSRDPLTAASLAPLKGILSAPVVSLLNAVNYHPKLRALGLESNVFVAENVGASKEPTDAHGLSAKEIAAIHLYTQASGMYQVTNELMRAADRDEIKPLFSLLKILCGGLTKLPRVSRTVYRGVKLSLVGEYPKGTKFFWWQFTSCTSSIEVLESPEFLGDTGDRTIFAIEAFDLVTVKDYSAIPKEDEWLLFPGVYMEVVSVLAAGGGLTVIQLRQVPAPPMVDALPPAVQPQQSSAPAPAPGPAPAVAAGATPLVQGDWNCAACGFMNFRARTQCKNCGANHVATATPAPTHASGIATSDWNCPKCNFKNFAGRQNCKNCGVAFPHGTVPTPAPAPAPGVAPSGGKPGDWNCPKCHFKNFASRQQCKNCGANAAPQPTPAPAPASQKPNACDWPVAGDWSCPKCSFMNFASRQQCKNCGSGSPTAGTAPVANAKPSDWNCAKCHFKNFASRQQCKNCHAPAMHPQQLPPQQVVKPGDWRCPCGTNNFAVRGVCFKCGNAKP